MPVDKTTNLYRMKPEQYEPNSNEGPPDRDCNCRVRANCHMDGKCLISSLVYKATMNSETYIGMTGGTFKTRYSSHKASFRHKEKESDTTLSKYIWS